MLGMGEIITIGVVALVVLGPEKFPDFAKSCFRTFRELRGHMDDLKSEVTKEINPLKGKMDELRRIDPEKYIDQLVEGDIEDEEDDIGKNPLLESVTPDYDLDNEREQYWSDSINNDGQETDGGGDVSLSSDPSSESSLNDEPNRDGEPEEYKPED